MTKREAERQTRQLDTLMSLGFTREESEALRRISMTLHRWYELECGTDSYCIVRGNWDRDTLSFQYDDNGRPYYEFAGCSGRGRYSLINDRETGAKKRLTKIMDARNRRNAEHDAFDYLRSGGFLRAYLQTDPRGAALYIIRPGDVPDGKDVHSYYTRGICVY